jgi:hypothetical protein
VGRQSVFSGKQQPLPSRCSGKILPPQREKPILSACKGGLMRFLNPDKTAVMDHSAAVASAVAWLGNRYLLATPVRRLTHLEGAVTHTASRRAPRVDPARPQFQPRRALQFT